MTAQTKISAKGQVVIPKDVRDRLNLAPGDALDVRETPEGILLSKPSCIRKKPMDEALANLRKIVDYKGPPATIEDMNRAVDEMFANTPPK
ncbi:MAG: AbrB/MazE/SpoVT family DNA-binding domain-containing protein [Pacificimonas sp.]